MSDCIVQTRNGVAFDILAPTPEMVRLDDIAWSLAHICRFNGHGTKFYSVAEHSSFGAICLAGGYGLMAQRAFLLHDSAEAYIGDICTPVKRALGARVVDIENRILGVVLQRFGITLDAAIMRILDQFMLGIEAKYLMGAKRVGNWPPADDIPHVEGLRCAEPRKAYEHFMMTAALLDVKELKS